MTAKKNILLIIPEMIMGGAQRSMAKLSVELARHHQVWVVIFNSNNSVGYTYGGNLVSLDVVPSANKLSKINSFYQRVVRLRRLKKKLSIDVSISFLEGADYINILSRVNDRIILSIRGSKLHDETMQRYFFGLRSKILIPFLYKKADVIVTVNRGISKELTDHYKLPKERIVIINNFYDFEEIEKLSHEPKELEPWYNDRTIVAVGRLAPEKRLRFLLVVFSMLKERYDDARIIVVGNGPEKQSLINTCEELKLQYADIHNFSEHSDVVFTGNQPNVFKYLRGSSVYVMNSSSEGFPNALVEAMICGVPIVSSDCYYGPREILTEQEDAHEKLTAPLFTLSGVLMPVDNEKQHAILWVDVLDKILSDRELRNKLSESGRQRSYTYSKEAIMDKWLTLL